MSQAELKSIQSGEPTVTPRIRLIRYAEVENFYPNLTPRQLEDACSESNGPRKFKPGIVSLHEIEAWILREERLKGTRN